ncbi:MAG: hypothetical protein GX260_00045 [Tissierellia bacterium]|nr:septum formation initiator family protein [Bacillota bacterium]NLL22156.1 hypothetical protein [Tissierellia bacterium]
MNFLRKRKVTIAVILILLAVGVYSFFYQKNQLAKLTEERLLLEMELARLKLVKAELQEQLENTGSREYIESVAMSEYGLVRPYEIIYYVTGEGE